VDSDLWRKGLAWSAEEDRLLVKLKEENLPWNEMLRRFDQNFLGRMPGSIEVSSRNRVEM
jgi:hypothetical protein